MCWYNSASLISVTDYKSSEFTHTPFIASIDDHIRHHRVSPSAKSSSDLLR